MNKLISLRNIRSKLQKGKCTIGSWIQLESPSSAEIIGNAKYDWVAVDLEHGSISISQLPNIFRALELGNTLPLARISEGSPNNCKRALDSGASGLIIPKIDSKKQLELSRKHRSILEENLLEVAIKLEDLDPKLTKQEAELEKG